MSMADITVKSFESQGNYIYTGCYDPPEHLQSMGASAHMPQIVVSYTTTRGGKLIIGRNKLLEQSTYLVVFWRRTGLALE